MRLAAFAAFSMLALVTGASAQQIQVMPSKAEVTYQGIYSFTESPKTRASRRVDVGRLLADALEGNGRGTLYEGAITLKVRFDGPAVTAEVSGTGGIATTTFSGLVENGVCRLLDRRGVAVYEGRCGPDSFEATITGTERYRANLRGSFRASATSFVDVAAREAQAAETRQAQEAEAAERRRVNEAKRAQLKAECDAGKLTACVEMDTLE